jgi:hypothetical protein
VLDRPTAATRRCDSGVPVDDIGDDVGEIDVWVDAIEVAGLDQRCDDSSMLAAAIRKRRREHSSCSGRSGGWCAPQHWNQFRCDKDRIAEDLSLFGKFTIGRMTTACGGGDPGAQWREDHGARRSLRAADRRRSFCIVGQGITCEPWPSQGVSGFGRIAVGAVQQRAQSLTRMLCHILTQLLDGQLRTMDVASLGEANREWSGLRR